MAVQEYMKLNDFLSLKVRTRGDEDGSGPIFSWKDVQKNPKEVSVWLKFEDRGDICVYFYDYLKGEYRFRQPLRSLKSALLKHDPEWNESKTFFIRGLNEVDNMTKVQDLRDYFKGN